MSSVPLSKVAQQAARAIASLIEEEIGQALSSDNWCKSRCMSRQM
jgi:hypothetical protein